MARKKVRKSPMRPNNRVAPPAGRAGTKRKAGWAAAVPEVLPFPDMAFPIVGVGASAGGFEAFREFLRALAGDLRQTAHQLHSTVLEHLGLGSALRALCEDFSRQHGITAKLAARGSYDAISGQAALSIYRVVQEALQIAAVYSGAQELRVSLTSRDGATHVSVGDDGRGFDLVQLRHKGLGLISMEERMRQVGGTFAIKTAPGEGTRMDIEVPAAKGGTSE